MSEDYAVTPDIHPARDLRSAVVTADGIATAYRRSGAGPTVILLADERAAPASYHALATALAVSFRVIAPELPTPFPLRPGAWLRGLFDGLGIREAALVSSVALSDVVIAFAKEEAERVKGFVLLAPADPLGSEGSTLREALSRLFD